MNAFDQKYTVKDKNEAQSTHSENLFILGITKKIVADPCTLILKKDLE